jgi:hypothetical protein
LAGVLGTSGCCGPGALVFGVAGGGICECACSADASKTAATNIRSIGIITCLMLADRCGGLVVSDGRKLGLDWFARFVCYVIRKLSP